MTFNTTRNLLTKRGFSTLVNQALSRDEASQISPTRTIAATIRGGDSHFAPKTSTTKSTHLTPCRDLIGGLDRLGGAAVASTDAAPSLPQLIMAPPPSPSVVAPAAPTATVLAQHKAATDSRAPDTHNRRPAMYSQLTLAAAAAANGKRHKPGHESKRFASTSAPVGSPLATSINHQASLVQPRELEFEDGEYFDSFRYDDLKIMRCHSSELKPKPPIDQLRFGHTFTDHMFRVDWSQETGWSEPVISKIHNFEIHPGAKVLHYAIQAFEGAKAFRGADNKIRFFRLDQNVRRLQKSAARLSLPPFDEDELIKCIHRLVSIDQEWVPHSNGHQQLNSLYIRPTILGLEPSLGVANSKRSTLYVLLSPAGPYFKTGVKPVSLYADPSFVRAWPGGAGSSKLGSNYAPTIMVQRIAEKLGLQQALWLYGDDMKLTEVGTMNIFVSYLNALTGKLHLATPPLTDGLILPGITRASILDLARQWSDVVCEERYLTMSEIGQLIREERLVEMFGAGTACIVSPISLIQMKDGTKFHIPYYDPNKGTVGAFHQKTINNNDINNNHRQGAPILSHRILRAITDIQYGRISHPWAQELCY